VQGYQSGALRFGGSLPQHDGFHHHILGPQLPRRADSIAGSRWRRAIAIYLGKTEAESVEKMSCRVAQMEKQVKVLILTQGE